MGVAAIIEQTRLAVEELLQAAKLCSGDVLVIGCSTSEVNGQKIGSAGSNDIAEAILNVICDICGSQNISIAIQCCEHLNRALVVERYVKNNYRLEEVTVIPAPKAGGALAAVAMRRFNDPVVVERIEAHAGLDIGCTLIGMHLKRVAVPIRLKHNYVGQALLKAAHTRPPLIGGARAQYECAVVK